MRLPAKLRAHLARILAMKAATGWCVLLGVVFSAGSLRIGLFGDDFFHAAILRDLDVPHPTSGHFDLFRFANGDPRSGHALMNFGQFPWTADPAARLAFFRPLSAATHVLDYALWPDAPWLMHAHSLFWFALTLLAAGAAYRRFLGPTWLAGFATLLFAIDDTHAPAIAWVANRNVFLAFALAFPVLLLHDRRRKGGAPVLPWLGAALFVLALLAGESALAIVAYLVAYAIHLDSGSWKSRAASIAPYAVLIVLWRLAYSHLGYGVSGSGVYLDPGRHPLEFLAALPRRLPLLLLGALGAPRSDFASLYEYLGPAALPAVVAGATVTLLLLAGAAYRTWRGSPVVRFFTTGMLLAMLPVCAAPIGDRLLVFASFGALGLVANMIAGAVTVGERVAAGYLVVFHVVLAPLQLVVRTGLINYEQGIDEADVTIPETPDVTSKTVVLVNPPNDAVACYIPILRAVRGEPMPARLRALADVVEDLDVTRVDERTIRVKPADGFLGHELERMVRSNIRGFSIGSTVDLDGMRVTITALTPDGRPGEAEFRFDSSLDGPSFVWLVWSAHAYAPWSPPRIGETTRLPAHDARWILHDIENRISKGSTGQR